MVVEEVKWGDIVRNDKRKKYQSVLLILLNVPLLLHVILLIELVDGPLSFRNSLLTLLRIPIFARLDLLSLLLSPRSTITGQSSRKYI